MSHVKTGPGRYVITPDGDNPRNINITVTLPAADDPNFGLEEIAIPSDVRAMQYNNTRVHWMTNFQFTKLSSKRNPTFSIVLPRNPSTTYVYYDAGVGRVLPLPLADPNSDPVSASLTTSDPAVGMT